MLPNTNRREARSAVSCSGFSLAELAVVVFLIAVLSMLIVPQFDLQGASLRASVSEVQAALVRAQRTAVMAQHNVIVQFDTDTDGVWVHQDRNNDGVRQSGEVATWYMLSAGTAFGLRGVPALEWGSDPVGFEDERVTFHRDGSSSRQGGVYISTGRQINAGRWPDETVALEVIRSTGSIRCRVFRDESWSETC